jgi:hypothetical protein
VAELDSEDEVLIEQMRQEFLMKKKKKKSTQNVDKEDDNNDDDIRSQDCVEERKAFERMNFE